MPRNFKSFSSLVKKLRQAHKKSLIQEFLTLKDNPQSYKIVFNPATGNDIRARLFEHMQMNYHNVLVSINTESEIIIRHMP